ncbi:ATP-NAD kinase-like domain-containing protein [Schizophyllum commune]
MVHRDIVIRLHGKTATLAFTDSALTVSRGAATDTSSARSAKSSDSASKSKSDVEVPLRNVLGAEFDEKTREIVIHFVSRKKKNGKGPHVLVKITGAVKDAENYTAKLWVDNLLQSVFTSSGVTNGRKLKVLVNPHGGQGKGLVVWRKRIEPIFKAAGCQIDLTITTHNGHAYDLAKTLALDYDAVVTVSGDGLIHEVLNGFAAHEQPTKALSIPIAPIPTGSGNGTALNLLGLADGFDVVAAALNAIRGHPMPVDLFSLVQDGKRSVSFMSQALGLMADLDLGTEHLRWMGDARFVYGFIRGVLSQKPCPIELYYKPAETDRQKMYKALQDRHATQATHQAHASTASVSFAVRPSSPFSSPATPFASSTPFSGPASPTTASTPSDRRPRSPMSEDGEDGLPPLVYSKSDSGNDDSWTKFEDPILFVYAGKGPYVARDLMAFPASLPDDGLIDITIHPMAPMGELFGAMNGAEKGELFWRKRLTYLKAHAFRVRPVASSPNREPQGNLSVDGERFPFKEFTVEVHQKLGRLMSMQGMYVCDFGKEAAKGKDVSASKAQEAAKPKANAEAATNGVALAPPPAAAKAKAPAAEPAQAPVTEAANVAPQAKEEAVPKATEEPAVAPEPANGTAEVEEATAKKAPTVATTTESAATAETPKAEATVEKAASEAAPNGDAPAPSATASAAEKH